MYPNERKIALVDLDDTLADYSKSMREKLAALASPDEPTYHRDNLPAWMEARESLIKNSPNFWFNLEPIPIGFKILKEIETVGFDVHITTVASFKAPSSWTEKVLWCQKYLADRKAHLTRDKSSIYGRLLFDDWPPYVTKWLHYRPRGHVIMLGQPHNVDFKHPRVLRINEDTYEEQLADLQQLLHAAFETR